MNSKRRNFRITFAVATVLLLAIAVFLMSVLNNLQGARVDMTDDGLFTMSPAAVEILQELQVPVQVKLYITPSEKMPQQLRTLERDINEQMRNFEGVADGMLEYSVFNPQDDEEMQQTLMAKGIQPFQVRSVDKDEIGVKLIWSAMTIAYKDKPEEILPQVLPQNLPALEQDIIGPVYRLTRDKTPKIAVFGPRKEVDQQLAMMYMQQGMQPPAPEDQFTLISEFLNQEHYEAVPVELTEQSPIPEDADLLIVMALTALNQRQVYEINRALSGGIPVIMGVQAHEYGYRPGQGQSRGWSISGQNIETGLEHLLAGIGIHVSEDHLLDTSMEVIDLPREVNLGGLRMQTREPVQLPVQIRVTETQMLQDSPLVNRIGTLFYLWGTPVLLDVTKLSENGLQATNLIESSSNSWLDSWSEGPLPASVFSPDGKEMTGPHVLAVLVEGQFPDTFETSGVPDWPADPAAAAEEAPGVTEPPAPVQPQPGQLLVIGSAKMFDNNILGASQNALLLMNAVDYMAGSQDLLTIRSKLLTQRVIRPVETGEKLIWRIVVILLVPLGLTVFGFMRAGMRRKDATNYRQDLKRNARGASR